MIIIEAEQGSPEWFAARIGIPTASRFKDIVTMNGAPSTSRKKYLYQLAGERLAGAKEDTYQSAAMARGVELEGEARLLYEMVHGVQVQQVGLCLHDSRRYGCSPDGLVGTHGLEIKCPSMAVHTQYLDEAKVPAEYHQQVQGSMLVTGLDAWTFMSYHPAIKPLHFMAKRDEPFLTKLQSELERFCDELDALTERLR